MKSWHGMNEIIEKNTNEEIIHELYIDGSTAMWTKRIAEVNAAIAKELEKKQKKIEQASQSEREK